MEIAGVWEGAARGDARDIERGVEEGGEAFGCRMGGYVEQVRVGNVRGKGLSSITRSSTSF